MLVDTVQVAARENLRDDISARRNLSDEGEVMVYADGVRRTIQSQGSRGATVTSCSIGRHDLTSVTPVRNTRQDPNLPGKMGDEGLQSDHAGRPLDHFGRVPHPHSRVERKATISRVEVAQNNVRIRQLVTTSRNRLWLYLTGLHDG